jgi:[acyl-carrier-protein] S-malonyltransferase
MQQDLWSLIQSGPEEVLAKTEITQPVMLLAGVAAWRIWETLTTVRPGLMAGHSLGEYTAYVCAGAMALEDAVKVVKLRGELMRDACPGATGKMAAVLGLDDAMVVACCQASAGTEVVQAVNFNAPGQVVIAGHNAAVDRAIEACKEAGARKAMPLAVSVPCHSQLMQPASERLGEALRAVNLQVPGIPVINNVDACIETRPEEIKEKLIKQLYSPVLWVDTVRLLGSRGIRLVVECGPGKVLSGMNKRIEKSLVLAAIQDLPTLADALEKVVNDQVE